MPITTGTVLAASSVASLSLLASGRRKIRAVRFVLSLQVGAGGPGRAFAYLTPSAQPQLMEAAIARQENIWSAANIAGQANEWQSVTFQDVINLEWSAGMPLLVRCETSINASCYFDISIQF